MGTNQNNFSIPIELCEKALREKLVKELKFVVVLKHLSPTGKFHKNKRNIEKACDKMGLRSKRSFYNYVNRITHLGWANVCDGVIYVRSWRRMALRIGISSTKHKARLKVKRDLEYFDAFLFSARICFSLEKRKARVARQKGRVIQSLDEVPVWSLKGWKHCPNKRGHAYREARQRFDFEDGEKFAPENISLSFMAEMLMINKTRVHRLKKKSSEAGYIGYKENWLDINVPVLFMDEFKEENPDIAHRVCETSRGNLKLRLTDSLFSYCIDFVSY